MRVPDGYWMGMEGSSPRAVRRTAWAEPVVELVWYGWDGSPRDACGVKAVSAALLWLTLVIPSASGATLAWRFLSTVRCKACNHGQQAAEFRCAVVSRAGCGESAALFLKHPVSQNVPVK